MVFFYSYVSSPEGTDVTGREITSGCGLLRCRERDSLLGLSFRRLSICSMVAGTIDNPKRHIIQRYLKMVKYNHLRWQMIFIPISPSFRWPMVTQRTAALAMAMAYDLGSHQTEVQPPGWHRSRYGTTVTRPRKRRSNLRHLPGMTQIQIRHCQRFKGSSSKINIKKSKVSTDKQH